MAKAAGLILNLDEGGAEELYAAVYSDVSSAEAVADFEHSRNAPLICFVSVGGAAITYVSPTRRGQIAAVGMHRLNGGPLTALSKPIAHTHLEAAVPPRLRRHLKARLTQEGLLPHSTFTVLVDAIVDAIPDTHPLLDRYSRQRSERIPRLSAEQHLALAYQKETLAAAMGIAGLD